MSVIERRVDEWDFGDLSVTLGDLPLPGPWARLGRCRTAPQSVFFPERGDDTRPAKAICARCPVLEECRAYAVAAPQTLQGVWGGTTGRERRQLRAAGVVPVVEPAASEAPRAKRAWRGDLYRNLVALSEHPGRWARVARYNSKGVASTQAAILRNGQREVPPGQWRFEGRYNELGGSDLFAMLEVEHHCAEVAG